MKVLVALAVLVAVAVAAPDGEHYEIDFDKLDVDGAIKNQEKLKMYSNCLLDLGECNNIGAALKKTLPEALESGCAKCSPSQKTVIRKVLLTGKQQLPQEYEQLVKKYDPEGKYHDSVTKFLSESD